MQREVSRFVSVVVCLFGVGATSAAWAKPPCRTIKGTVETQQATAGCQSPIGLCFAGTLQTNSFLRGDTWFTATFAQPDEDEPALLHYAGVLEVTLPNGRTVMLQSTGVLDTSTGTFTETEIATGNPAATLNVSGTTNAALSAFSGQISGQLCGTPPKK